MSHTIYQGPSMIDGDPIRGVVTTTSVNSKLTARLHAEVLQLWILPDLVHPTLAIQSGEDRSVCGSCPLRAYRDGEKVKRLCYVSPQPITSVWRHSHGQAVISPREAVRGSRADLLRLGAYGDPAALPFDLVDELCREALAAGVRRRAGYTHQAGHCDARWRRLVMASAEGAQRALELQLLGWRTFTVVPTDEGPGPDAITCPASDERGHKTTCEKCGLCDGARPGGDNRKNISIGVHGERKHTRNAALVQLLDRPQPITENT